MKHGSDTYWFIKLIECNKLEVRPNVEIFIRVGKWILLSVIRFDFGNSVIW